MQLYSLGSNKSLCQAFEFAWQQRRFVSVYSQNLFVEHGSSIENLGTHKLRKSQIHCFSSAISPVSTMDMFEQRSLAFFSRQKQPDFFINLRPSGYFKQFCDSVYFFSHTPEQRRKSTKINISKAVGACFLIWRLSDKALTRILIYGAFISVYEEFNCRDTTQNRHQLWYSYTFV